MDILLWIILGLIQGFAEALPISSSAHLALARQLLGFRDFNFVLAVGLHAGSLLIIVYWFRRDIAWLWQGIRTSWRDVTIWVVKRGRNPLDRPSERRVPYFLAVSLVPLAVEGYLLRNYAVSVFRDENWALVLLILNGLIIVATARWTRGERTLGDLRLREYLFIAATQGLSVLPGISRLGVTLCAGLSRRLNWYEALRLSFLYALPALAAAILAEAPALVQSLQDLPELALGFTLRLMVVIPATVLGLRLLMSSMLERRTLTFFGYYCCMLGLFALVYFAVGF